MNRDTYVAYNAYFDSGGPWGILGSTFAGFVEDITQRPFRTLFHSLSGSSMGGVNATSLAMGASALHLMHSTYACSIDLLDRPSESIVINQLINQRLLGGRHVFRDHYDHDILYRMLKPHYGDMTMGDAGCSLLMTAHNMSKKRDELLGRIDSDLFDVSALKMPLVNGTTPLIDGAMATTAIPGVFLPYTIKGDHYRDNGMVISAGHVHKELDAALKARHAALHVETPRGRLDFLRKLFAREAEKGPVTLVNADHALVRTLFLGTGDIADIPYTAATQHYAGFMGAVGNTEYSTLHATKNSAWAQDRRDMERGYDPASIAATGMPAITPINRSIIARPDTDEVGKFPSPSPLDATPGNLCKVFYVAALNVADNIGKAATVLHEVADMQLAQGRSNAEESLKLHRAADVIGMEDPWQVLERIIVTEKNGPAIYAKYSQKPKPAKRTHGWRNQALTA